MHARFQVDVIKGPEDREAPLRAGREIMALGAYRPVDDALRIAFTELIAWIHLETGVFDLTAGARARAAGPT